MNRKHYIILAVVVLFSATIFYLSLSSYSSSHHSSSIDSQTSSFVKSRTVAQGQQIENDSIPGFEIGQSLIYKNLEIITILGTFENDRQYVSLEAAMEKDLVKLIETSNVSELNITNQSDQYIYLQSGDIVKGGKQDRTLQMDVVLAPQMKNVPIASFCVESGRWQQRQDEDVTEFAASEKSLSSKDLKLSARKSANQQEVWRDVSVQKEKLNQNLSYSFGTAVDVNDDASPSSLQLTLENKQVNEMIEQYKEAFASLPSDQVVGFAYAVNGKIYGAEIYNNAVFNDLKEKTLNSFITEAIAEADTGNITFEKMAVEAWISFIAPIIETNKSYYQKVNDVTGFLAEESDSIARFTSYDIGIQKWIHISILEDSGAETKDVPAPPPPPIYTR